MPGSVLYCIGKKDFGQGEKFMNIEEMKKIKYESLGHGIIGSTGLSWLFCVNSTMASLPAFEISKEEKTYLQGLARRVKELSELPVQEERKQLWKDHLSLKETRPAVFIDPEGAWYEIIPHTSLLCQNDLARLWEMRLRKEIYWQEHICDDRVCRGEFSYQDIVSFSDFGLKEKKIGEGGGRAYKVVPVIEDYDRDLPKLHYRELYYDRAASARVAELCHDVFDGILEVKRDNAFWYSAGLSVDAIALRGFDNFLYDFYDYPDELKSLMAFLRDDWLNMLSLLEENGLLTLNNGGEFMGTGGYGWCDELPAADFKAGHVRPIDMWGYGESQETVSTSPAFFDEFILTYQLPILEKFGMNSYGCCEPLDTRIDILMEKVPRLRKVVVSPWSDLRFMAEKLKRNYALCWKVNPARIASPDIDEDVIRKELREGFAITKQHGCTVEVLNRDIQTLGFCPENAGKWARIAMDEALRY